MVAKEPSCFLLRKKNCLKKPKIESCFCWVVLLLISLCEAWIPPPSFDTTMRLTRGRILLAKVEGFVPSAVSATMKNQISQMGVNSEEEESSANVAVPVTPSPKKASRKRKVSVGSRPKDASEAKAATSRTIWTRKIVQGINADQPFIDLDVPPSELRPSATLTTGQSFVWRAVLEADIQEVEKATASSAWGSHNATEWVGVLRINSDLSVAIVIRETPTTTLFRSLSPCPVDLDLKRTLRSYFQLDDSLEELYTSWSQEDTRLATIARCIPGVRILDQDPFECLISFICSSNNNIPRITKMVNAIRREYGNVLLDSKQGTPESLYSFPSINTLLQRATDEDLRQKCGLGYRSKYILETLQLLKDKGGEEYLKELRQTKDPLKVQVRLCEFCGVGRKVADCVALFSLKQEDAIPVDVHVWNIARRDYDEDGILDQIKSLTPTTYKQVGDVFRNRFPEKAGWAHSLLFVAELPSFRPVLPDAIVQQMEDFQREEKLRKLEAKATKKGRQ